MTVIKEYSEDYYKEDYYVHVSIPALDHPIPLQTPDVAVEIYRETGYTAGDQVLDDLVWQLYDLELHWTEGQGGTEVVTELEDGDGELPHLSEADLEDEDREDPLTTEEEHELMPFTWFPCDS